jgi:hypothetical protein
MGLSSSLIAAPPPCLYVPDDCLAAFVDRDVLHHHPLLPFGSVALQRFHLV